jgi:hypothetical protein
MSNWLCDACGQRIRHAREGWISIVQMHERCAPLIVHHHATSPWSAWGGCDAPDEVASLHLSEAFRDPRALEQLVALQLLDVAQFASLQRRLRGTSAAAGYDAVQRVSGNELARS